MVRLVEVIIRCSFCRWSCSIRRLRLKLCMQLQCLRVTLYWSTLRPLSAELPLKYDSDPFLTPGHDFQRVAAVCPWTGFPDQSDVRRVFWFEVLMHGSLTLQILNHRGGEEYKFSTTLRQSIPADSVLPSSFIPGSSGSGNPYNSSSAHPKRQSTHDAFAHTAHTATPSARYARMTGPQVLLDLNSSDSTGLHSHVVAAIRTLSGPNDFAVGAQENVYLKFAKQFYESPLNLLLLGSAAVSALVGNLDDAISISLAIVIVVTVGFVQEQRSEKSLEALNRLVPHYCHVLRDGAMRTELANILVPGDIVTFSTGDRVPADVRLLTAADLEIDESSLTGETHPARKTTDAIPTSATAASNSARAASPAVGHHEILGIAERTNTGFMGTLVKSGRGTGVVVATGDSTEFGVIFSMMQDVEDRKTPLQVSMDELATKLSAASFVIIGFICLIGVWQQRSWLEMFTIGGQDHLS